MLEAGTGVADISPRGPVPLYGYPHVERVSTGIHDPLLATATVLCQGGATVVLVSLEILMIEPDVARGLRAVAAEAGGCDEADVLISCTHTHSGPVTSSLLAWAGDRTIPRPDPEYLGRIGERLADAVREARASCVPAELAWARADATGIGGNRLREGGVTDPDCGVLALRRADSREWVGVSVIYGMHPTVLHEDSTLISADFPYYARRQVQEHAGRDIPVSYHMAPAGNQSTRRFVRGQTFAEAERLGRRLGNAVCAALDNLNDEAWDRAPRLGGARRSVSLPRNRICAPAEAEALLRTCTARYERLKREGAPRSDVRTAECAVFGAEGRAALARAAADGSLDAKLAAYARVDVQVLRVGGVQVAGLPGECFTEYGLEIRRRAPGRAFVVTLVNGELQGYIVTPEAAAQDGYEAANAVFAPEAGRVMVDAVLAMMGE
ncbi:MAG: neutral/alkaline non-lysosomal ceramidase N-terminal domain-containing protein [Lentisphaerae bacterium]|nr:neutral/alkaline non-lysosomal ceramidase N-terminal domain-containing protein [Lentisphaerota bacterium]